ncbi:MAG: alpha-amylase [Chloroflexi bacterium]|nr:alpha-amylase [Chloroflexota bacterium]
MQLKSSEALWWQRGVIYQIYPRSFKDNNNDGIGDLQGVISKLDYLAELGIEAIWLSPIYPSPMADFGYDVSDYCDINPMFGTLGDFDTLVKDAHQRGLSVVIDFVPNHSSDQHPWFIESRSSRKNPKRNWYFWADPLEDGSPPNNWLSVFGGSAWEWDETTQQYYLHSFLKEQPDLNWRNPEVKQAMLNAVRFWLERDVDGFRIDVAHFIMKDPHLSDNPPNEDMKTDFKPLGDYDSQLHIHDKGHPDIHGVMREFRALLDSYSTRRPRFSVGEIHIFDWAEWAKYYGEKLDELHMPFNFGFIGTAWNPQIFQKVIEGVEAAVPQGAWPNYVLGNHDEHRIASRVGADAARSAMMLLLTLRGTPTLYYGDEIGMHDVDILPELEQDPWGKNVKGIGLGRDPERTPMQWDASANAGFSAAGVQTWLRIADDYAEVNVANQLKDTRSMLALTRRLLTLRRATPALHVGSYRTVQQSNEHCLAYIREYESERWLVALNFSDAAQTLNLPLNQSGQIVLSTGLDREESVNLGSLHLRANEGCLIKLG